MATARFISLRGVEVHNLRAIDLDIPHRKLVVLCGVSGSGKSSLALDTLYAEGQRRYIESFSAYTRQFLERLEKPDADRIDGIPPAVAVTSRGGGSRSSRSTVGTATETADYLRLLFAKIGHMFCHRCGQEVRRESPQSVAEEFARLPEGARAMVAFSTIAPETGGLHSVAAGLMEEGFIRWIAGDRVVNLSEEPGGLLAASVDPLRCNYVVVDRLAAGRTSPTRVRDSLEVAFRKGGGRCLLFIEETEPATGGRGAIQCIDGRPWRRLPYSTHLACEDCGLDYPAPEPRLYSFNSPLGACPRCEGFGNIIDVDMDLIVPDRSKSLRDGAIAPWNSPSYAHELEELVALAGDYGLPVDVPFEQLEAGHIDLIRDGVPERNFGGLRGFFDWLERRKYKMHIRVFLSRWRSYRPCPDCGGSRLRREALATRIGGKNIAEI
jgi:excinuclease ABC subunit A